MTGGSAQRRREDEEAQQPIQIPSQLPPPGAAIQPQPQATALRDGYHSVHNAILELNPLLAQIAVATFDFRAARRTINRVIRQIGATPDIGQGRLQDELANITARLDQAEALFRSDPNSCRSYLRDVFAQLNQLGQVADLESRMFSSSFHSLTSLDPLVIAFLDGLEATVCDCSSVADPSSGGQQRIQRARFITEQATRYVDNIYSLNVDETCASPELVERARGLKQQIFAVVAQRGREARASAEYSASQQAADAAFATQTSNNLASLRADIFHYTTDLFRLWIAQLQTNPFLELPAQRATALVASLHDQIRRIGDQRYYDDEEERRIRDLIDRYHIETGTTVLTDDQREDAIRAVGQSLARLGPGRVGSAAWYGYLALRLLGPGNFDDPNSLGLAALAVVMGQIKRQNVSVDAAVVEQVNALITGRVVGAAVSAETLRQLHNQLAAPYIQAQLAPMIREHREFFSRQALEHRDRLAVVYYTIVDRANHNNADGAQRLLSMLLSYYQILRSWPAGTSSSWFGREQMERAMDEEINGRNGSATFVLGHQVYELSQNENELRTIVENRLARTVGVQRQFSLSVLDSVRQLLQSGTVENLERARMTLMLLEGYVNNIVLSGASDERRRVYGFYQDDLPAIIRMEHAIRSLLEAPSIATQIRNQISFEFLQGQNQLRLNYINRQLDEFERTATLISVLPNISSRAANAQAVIRETITRVRSLLDQAISRNRTDGAITINPIFVITAFNIVQAATPAIQAIRARTTSADSAQQLAHPGMDNLIAGLGSVSSFVPSSLTLDPTRTYRDFNHGADLIAAGRQSLRNSYSLLADFENLRNFRFGSFSYPNQPNQSPGILRIANSDATITLSEIFALDSSNTLRTLLEGCERLARAGNVRDYYQAKERFVARIQDLGLRAVLLASLDGMETGMRESTRQLISPWLERPNNSALRRDFDRMTMQVFFHDRIMGMQPQNRPEDSAFPQAFRNELGLLGSRHNLLAARLRNADRPFTQQDVADYRQLLEEYRSLRQRMQAYHVAHQRLLFVQESITGVQSSTSATQVLTQPSIRRDTHVHLQTARTFLQQAQAALVDPSLSTELAAQRARNNYNQAIDELTYALIIYRARDVLPGRIGDSPNSATIRSEFDGLFRFYREGQSQFFASLLSQTAQTQTGQQSTTTNRNYEGLCTLETSILGIPLLRLDADDRRQVVEAQGEVVQQILADRLDRARDILHRLQSNIGIQQQDRQLITTLLGLGSLAIPYVGPYISAGIFLGSTLDNAAVDYANHGRLSHQSIIDGALVLSPFMLQGIVALPRALRVASVGVRSFARGSRFTALSSPAAEFSRAMRLITPAVRTGAHVSGIGLMAYMSGQEFSHSIGFFEQGNYGDAIFHTGLGIFPWAYMYAAHRTGQRRRIRAQLAARPEGSEVVFDIITIRRAGRATGLEARRLARGTEGSIRIPGTREPPTQTVRSTVPEQVAQQPAEQAAAAIRSATTEPAQTHLRDSAQALNREIETLGEDAGTRARQQQELARATEHANEAYVRFNERNDLVVQNAQVARENANNQRTGELLAPRREQLRQNQERISQIDRELLRGQREGESLEQRNHEINSQLRDLERRVPAGDTTTQIPALEITHLRQELRANETRLQELSRENQALTTERSRLNSVNDRISVEIQSYEGEQGRVQRRSDTISSRLAEIDPLYAERAQAAARAADTSLLQVLRDSYQRRVEEIDRQLAERSTAQSTFNRATRDLEQANRALGEACRNHAEANSTVNQLATERNQLIVERNDTATNRTRQIELDDLLRQKNEELANAQRRLQGFSSLMRDSERQQRAAQHDYAQAEQNILRLDPLQDQIFRSIEAVERFADEAAIFDSSLSNRGGLPEQKIDNMIDALAALEARRNRRTAGTNADEARAAGDAQLLLYRRLLTNETTRNLFEQRFRERINADTSLRHLHERLGALQRSDRNPRGLIDQSGNLITGEGTSQTRTPPGEINEQHVRQIIIAIADHYFLDPAVLTQPNGLDIFFSNIQRILGRDQPFTPQERADILRQNLATHFQLQILMRTQYSQSQNAVVEAVVRVEPGQNNSALRAARDEIARRVRENHPESSQQLRDTSSVLSDALRSEPIRTQLRDQVRDALGGLTNRAAQEAARQFNEALEGGNVNGAMNGLADAVSTQLTDQYQTLSRRLPQDTSGGDFLTQFDQAMQDFRINLGRGDYTTAQNNLQTAREAINRLSGNTRSLDLLLQFNGFVNSLHSNPAISQNIAVMASLRQAIQNPPVQQILRPTEWRPRVRAVGARAWAGIRRAGQATGAVVWPGLFPEQYRAHWSYGLPLHPRGATAGQIVWPSLMQIGRVGGGYIGLIWLPGMFLSRQEQRNIENANADITYRFNLEGDASSQLGMRGINRQNLSWLYDNAAWTVRLPAVQSPPSQQAGQPIAGREFSQAERYLLSLPQFYPMNSEAVHDLRPQTNEELTAFIADPQNSRSFVINMWRRAEVFNRLLTLGRNAIGSDDLETTSRYVVALADVQSTNREQRKRGIRALRSLNPPSASGQAPLMADTNRSEFAFIIDAHAELARRLSDSDRQELVNRAIEQINRRVGSTRRLEISDLWQLHADELRRDGLLQTPLEAVAYTFLRDCGITNVQFLTTASRYLAIRPDAFQRLFSEVREGSVPISRVEQYLLGNWALATRGAQNPNAVAVRARQESDRTLLPSAMQQDSFLSILDLRASREPRFRERVFDQILERYRGNMVHAIEQFNSFSITRAEQIYGDSIAIQILAAVIVDPSINDQQLVSLLGLSGNEVNQAQALRAQLVPTPGSTPQDVLINARRIGLVAPRIFEELDSNFILPNQRPVQDSRSPTYYELVRFALAHSDISDWSHPENGTGIIPFILRNREHLQRTDLPGQPLSGTVAGFLVHLYSDPRINSSQGVQPEAQGALFDSRTSQGTLNNRIQSLDRNTTISIRYGSGFESRRIWFGFGPETSLQAGQAAPAANEAQPPPPTGVLIQQLQPQDPRSSVTGGRANGTAASASQRISFSSYGHITAIPGRQHLFEFPIISQQDMQATDGNGQQLQLHQIYLNYLTTKFDEIPSVTRNDIENGLSAFVSAHFQRIHGRAPTSGELQERLRRVYAYALAQAHLASRDIANQSTTSQDQINRARSLFTSPQSEFNLTSTNSCLVLENPIPNNQQNPTRLIVGFVLDPSNEAYNSQAIETLINQALAAFGERSAARRVAPRRPGVASTRRR